MKLLLAIVIILVISILGSRFTFLNRRFSLGFRNLLLTGTEYLLIGVVLGRLGFNILDSDALIKLEPFLVFGLCWIGFLFGLQFKIRQLKNLPGFYFTISATQAFVTFLLVAISMYFIFKQYTVIPVNVLVMIAITLGGSASCTAQSALAIVSQNYKFKNRKLLDLMRYISGIDGFYALCFFALALSIFPGSKITSFNLYKSLKWLFVSNAMGIIPALILISLSRVRFTQQEFSVFLIGTVILCGGLAYQINYSPLISGLICGVITANFSRHHLRALSEVLHAEKSIYIILLLLLGASWYIRDSFSLIIACIYILIRILGKFFGAFLGANLFKPGFKVLPTLGLGLISEGGHAVAIIINFKLLFPSFADSLTTIIIISLFVNELFGPFLILKQFDKKERIHVNVRQSFKKNTEKGVKK